ncbi:MAG: uracil-xanthine permease family protein [Treponemataceae bacterium]
MQKLGSKMFIFGFQHTFVMFGATVLVPLITGLDVGVTLLVAGVGTWIFHVLTKFKVPVFLGSSFSFIPGILAMTAAGSGNMPYALGGIVVAGGVYIIVAIIFKCINYEVLHKILPSYVTGPMIILIGLILAPVAIQNANGTHSPQIVAKIGILGCWAIALFTFISSIIVRVFFAKIGWKLLSNLPVLLALVAGYLAAVIAGVVDFSHVQSAGWIGVPQFTFAKFNLEGIAIMVPIAIVTIVEHFGNILTIGKVCNEDFIKNPGIHRTLLGDGIATSLAGLVGGPANTTYAENTGAIALTGIKDPVIMRIAATFAILLGLIPKFTSLIGSIPGPVIGGISILLFGMIASIGVRNMIDSKVNLEDPKILIIVSAMLVLGLGGASFQLGSVNLSGLGLAAIFGIVLNLILRPENSKK